MSNRHQQEFSNENSTPGDNAKKTYESKLRIVRKITYKGIPMTEYFQIIPLSPKKKKKTNRFSK